MSNSLIFPTIHRNGTSSKELLQQVLDARSALRASVKAVQNACPNGRDYYLQGDRSIYVALEQHENRLAVLDGVYRELGQIAEAIVNQEAP